MRIIDLQQIIYIASNIGVDMLSDTEIKLLKQAGVSVEQLKQTPFEQMYRWGILSMSLGDSKSKNLDYKDFKNNLINNRILTPVENNALNVAKTQALHDIKGLGNKIKKDTGQLLIEYDKKKRAVYEKKIRNSLKKNIKERGSLQNLVSKIGHKTSDWARDFERISDFVMHQSFEEGRAMDIKNEYGDDALVYKKVFNSACKKCISLYYTNGVNSKPVVFKVSELQANGNNIGRKVIDWLPVIGPTHPWCRCMLVHIDNNYEWNFKDKDFSKPKEYKRKVKRRSKTRISIGDEIMEV